MQYRNFGKLDFKPSALGFGAMRLPVIDDDYSKIDEEKAIEMIRYAIDNGVNYLDTAWPYHGKNSEPLVGKALQDGYREKVKLATKLPTWLIKEPGDMDKYLDQQLNKLQTNYIDFYLLHSLNNDFWKNLKKHKIFDWIEQKIAEGKIKHIGFSFHDDYPLFKEIIDSYDWDFCQIQYNYLDIKNQAGQQGLKYAAAKDIAVVIMEPLLGGKLASNQPPAIKEIWSNTTIDRTPADWALQWLWNQAEVSLILSGMSTLEQVKENLDSADNSAVGSLSSRELEIIESVRKKYEEISPINCTGCRYCLPCPNGVAIPDNFSLYNEAHIYNKYEEKKKKYNNMPEKVRASACIACGECETACPQNLDIITLLDKIDDYFKEI